MGKIKGEIYKYYKLKFAANDPNNSSPRLPKWQCRFCSRTYVQNATKMRHHVLNMCEEIPAPLKLALLDIPNIHDDASDDTTLEILNSLGVGCSSSPDASSPKFANRFSPSKQPPKKRKSVSTPYTSALQQPEATTTSRLGNNNLSIFLSSNNNVSTVSTVDQESLPVLLSRAILASGSSLSLLENPYWIDAFQSISPGIPLPTKQSIMKDFLDQEFQQYQQDNEKQIADAKFVSMQCEAWFNNRDESLVTIVVNTPSPVSYKTFQTGDTNQHDPMVIADCAVQTIRGIGELKVLSLVTKTNSHMTKMWTHVKTEYPNIITFGCVVEALNMLLVSILENQQVSDILQTFKGICRKVKSSSAVKSKFDQIQRQINGKVQKFNLPTRSNWISHVVFIQSVQNVQGALKLLAMDEESRPLMMMSDDELHLLISDEIWAKIYIICKVLHPVVKWLTYMKKKPEIYLVSNAFVECKRVFDSILEENSASIWRDTLYPELLDCWTKVKAGCMHHVHLAANLLDPVEQGSLLTQDEILLATEFIDNFCDTHDLDSGRVVAELSQFRMKTDFYAKNFLWKVTEKVQGSMWWSTMAPKTHLAQLAAALLNIAPSTFSMDDPGNNCFVESSDCKYIYVTHNLRMNSQALSVTAKRPPADTASGEDKKPFPANGCDLNSLEIMDNLSDGESDAEMVESTEVSTDHIE